MKICIYCSASEKIDKKYKDALTALGKTLAESGHELVFGGGAHGLMGAAARGFTAGGGKITGIIPKFFREKNVEALYDRCDMTIWVDDMHERKRLMENTSDAFIIAPGGVGTYDEFFSVLTNKQLDRTTKPIVVYNLCGFYDEMLKMIGRSVKEKFISEGCYDLFAIKDTAEEVIVYLTSDEPYEYLKKKKNLKDG